jgi:putative ABC transport system permease protein
MMNPFTWFRRSRLNDVSDEIRSHIEEKTDEFVASGMSRADAELAARRAFGNVVKLQETARDVWRLAALIDSLATDVRYALRGLAQKPGFAIAVILTLALGIGANAVVFALVNAVVLRPLPYPDSDRIISASQHIEGRDGGVMQDYSYAEWTESTQTLESHAAYTEISAVLRTPEWSSKLTGLTTTYRYFSIFGVRPLLGRTYDESETLPGAPQVVVLSERLWRTKFGADPAAIGRTAQFDGVRRLVVGVLPEWFTYGRVEQFWIPMRVAPAPFVRNAASGEVVLYSVVARLKAGVRLEAARSELATVVARLAAGHNEMVRTAVVMTLHERRHGETRRPLLLLFGAVGVLLLTACANIANLALARAARREREFALRLALGAGRWRIVRFVLIENLALAAGGAVLGMLLVSASLGWFVRISPGSIQNVDGIGVSGALITYTSVVAIGAALLFGLAPALTASRSALNRILASGTSQAAGSRRQSRARRALVVGQLAVALVFLTGAGLVAKTFWRMTFVDPGFRPEKLLAVNLELPANWYKEASAAAFFAELKARVEREPGVQSIAFAVGAPMAGGQRAAGGYAPREGGPYVRFRDVIVDPAYLETIGGKLVSGRFFGPEDRAGAPRVLVVSEDYVRLNLRGRPAIGWTFRVAKQPRTIVGVVKEIVQEEIDGYHYPLRLFPAAQVYGEVLRMGADPYAGQLIIRTTGQPEQLQEPIRQAVKALDPAQPPPEFTVMERSLDQRVAPRRFTLALLGTFAALAFALAVIGLYSVLAYLVTERTREFGIRIALGAQPGRVTRMVLGHGLRFTIVGLMLGGLISIAAVRVLRAWMYEMSVYDAPTFVAVSLLLGIVALVASWLPARRAGRVDPVQALRAE